MREEILHAAAVRFARYGFGKTTIEEIASDLNKVKSSVYYYFENKEDIFKAVIENELEKFAVMLRENIRMAKTPKEKLRAFITSHLQIFEKLAKGYSTIKDIYFSKHDIVQKTRAEYDKREAVILESILSKGNRSKEFRVSDIKNTVLVILTAVKGAEQEFLAAKSVKNMKSLSETMADILVNGVSKEKTK
ncbi:MAG: TetR/AcrR family transcriptional regulator [Endomicrobia bacterium]|nr:TetR/AcrR family transcriptional regulator [Bacillota bacterium]MCL1973099.1 TetR/AcrR family transcriptional regulator [Endomicrobiia bacterium]